MRLYELKDLIDVLKDKAVQEMLQNAGNPHQHTFLLGQYTALAKISAHIDEMIEQDIKAMYEEQEDSQRC